MDIHSEIEITIDADELVEEARETIESIIDEHLGNSYTIVRSQGFMKWFKTYQAR